MAPFPDEVDVFSGPHSTMKHLVDCYSEMLSCTDFSDMEATETLLRNLYSTFCVFRSHEQIENEFIMYRLRSRLKTLDVVDPHDSVVCNCHSDNRLTEMLQLVGDGLEKRTTSSPAERVCYGRLLKAALADFTRSFLPHMKEEEEVFQPLLIKYFEYDELVSLKETVTEQHQRLSESDEKFCLETRDIDSKPDFNTEAVTLHHFDRLPPELVLKVFSYLWPPDLGRCAKVCSKWNDLAYHPSLWQCIVPANWARESWQHPYDVYSPDDDPCYLSSCSRRCSRSIDEDGDVDESLREEAEDEDDFRRKFGCRIRDREKTILQALQYFLLPRVGINVRLLSFAGFRILDGKQLAAVLSHCPNVNHLDLSYTNFNDNDTFILSAEFEKIKSRGLLMTYPQPAHLDLSACSMLSDDGFERFIMFFVHTPKLTYLNLSGCSRITDKGINYLFATASSLPSLRYLNLSGCWNLSGISLSDYVNRCPKLEPKNLYYCDHITDGPYPKTANGCQNLGCAVRLCCCK